MTESDDFQVLSIEITNPGQLARSLTHMTFKVEVRLRSEEVVVLEGGVRRVLGGVPEGRHEEVRGLLSDVLTRLQEGELQNNRWTADG